MRVILHTGATIDENTWDLVEQELINRQFQTYETREDWRKDVCERALHHTGEELDDFGTAYSFMWELSRAQWVNVVPSPDRRLDK